MIHALSRVSHKTISHVENYLDSVVQKDFNTKSLDSVFCWMTDVLINPGICDKLVCLDLYGRRKNTKNRPSILKFDNSIVPPGWYEKDAKSLIKIVENAIPGHEIERLLKILPSVEEIHAKLGMKEKGIRNFKGEGTNLSTTFEKSIGFVSPVSSKLGNTLVGLFRMKEFLQSWLPIRVSRQPVHLHKDEVKHTGRQVDGAIGILYLKGGNAKIRFKDDFTNEVIEIPIGDNVFISWPNYRFSHGIVIDEKKYVLPDSSTSDMTRISPETDRFKPKRSVLSDNTRIMLGPFTTSSDKYHLLYCGYDESNLDNAYDLSVRPEPTRWLKMSDLGGRNAVF